MASEQRKIERVIPKMGIVTRLRESRGTNPLFPGVRRQELRFKHARLHDLLVIEFPEVQKYCTDTGPIIRSFENKKL